MANQLYRQSACSLVNQLKSGQISIEDTLDSVEQRIDATDAAINALPTRCFDRARQHAQKIQSLAVERRGLLAGLPVTIKDLMPVSGVRTTFGSRVYQQNIADQSDRLVERIEQQGGIVYAKSNTPEFGTGGITFNDVFGITRSPHNTRFASGGSSGGAAASLAAGSAWLSHGSDMAGSMRTPASFCGACSLRASPGKILSGSEFTPFDFLAVEGPMARDVQDLALFADVMMTANTESMLQAAQTPELPTRIAVSYDLGIATIDDDVLAVFQRFVETLIHSRGKVVESSPDLAGVHNAFDVLRAQAYAISLEQTLTQHPGVMKPEVVWNIETGLALGSDQIRQATRQQGQIINRAAEFMQGVDLLICPATSVSSVAAELRYPGSEGDVPVAEYYRWLAIAYATTMTALPIITLPCGFAPNGMPVGIQLIGKPGGEAALFRQARAIEREIGWSAQPVDPQTDLAI
jgi:amidase